jgi:hypothetical protein
MIPIAPAQCTCFCTPIYIFRIGSYFRASTACWRACDVPNGCCTERSRGLSGTTTSSNSSCEMALMVYVSAKRETMFRVEAIMVRTYANYQRADGGAGDCVFEQVRRAGSQQGWRCPHTVVIVGRAERFAANVSIHPQRPIGTPPNSLYHGGVLRLSRSCGEQKGPFAAVVSSTHARQGLAGSCRSSRLRQTDGVTLTSTS